MQLGFTRAVPTILYASLLVCSAGLNVFQAERLRSLSIKLASTRPEAASGSLAEGAAVPPAEVKDLDGRELLINYGGTGAATVLYILSPSCPWCAQNESNIKYLAQHAGAGYRFVGISLSSQGLAAYLRDHNLGFPVYDEPSQPTSVAYKLGPTPQTIVVSTDGRVLRSWTGSYGGINRLLIERFFRISLPGG